MSRAFWLLWRLCTLSACLLKFLKEKIGVMFVPGRAQVFVPFPGGHCWVNFIVLQGLLEAPAGGAAVCDEFAEIIVVPIHVLCWKVNQIVVGFCICYPAFNRFSRWCSNGAVDGQLVFWWFMHFFGICLGYRLKIARNYRSCHFLFFLWYSWVRWFAVEARTDHLSGCHRDGMLFCRFLIFFVSFSFEISMIFAFPLLG